MPSPFSTSPTSLRDRNLQYLKRLYQIRVRQGAVVYTRYTQAQIAEELGYSPSQFSRLMQPSQRDDGHQRLLTRLENTARLRQLERQRPALIGAASLAILLCLMVLVRYSPSRAGWTSSTPPPISSVDETVLLLDRTQLEPIVSNHIKRMNFQIATEIISFFGNYKMGAYSGLLLDKQYEVLAEQVFHVVVEGRNDLRAMQLVAPNGHNIVDLLPDEQQMRIRLNRIFSEVKPLVLQANFGFKEMQDLVLKVNRDEQALITQHFWEKWQAIAQNYSFPEPPAIQLSSRKQLTKGQLAALAELYDRQVEYRMVMAGVLFNAAIKSGAFPPRDTASQLNKLRAQLNGILLDSRALIERLNVETENGLPFYDTLVENSSNEIDRDFQTLTPLLLNPEIELGQLATMIREKIEFVQDRPPARFLEEIATDR